MYDHSTDGISVTYIFFAEILQSPTSQAVRSVVDLPVMLEQLCAALVIDHTILFFFSPASSAAVLCVEFWGGVK